MLAEYGQGGRKGKRKRKNKGADDDFDLGDLTAFKRTKTMAQAARGSVFINKKAKGRQIDVSGANMDLASDREEDELALNKRASMDSMDGNKYSLKQYNRDRKARLYQFDYSMDAPIEEEPETMDIKVMNATKLKINCMGNLEVSLFWEEKLAVLIRTA